MPIDAILLSLSQISQHRCNTTVKMCNLHDAPLPSVTVTTDLCITYKGKVNIDGCVISRNAWRPTFSIPFFIYDCPAYHGLHTHYCLLKGTSV